MTPQQDNQPAEDVLLVVPCLNEEAHIGGLLEWLRAEADTIPMKIVVADGGSTDKTRDIVSRVAATDRRVILFDNPDQLQSAGVNRAVAAFGDGRRWLVRVDAHSHYPEGYVAALVAEAQTVGADSVVVALTTVGAQPFQRAVAAAQNSILGTGGAAHRIGSGGRFVNHGHHGLMRMDAFRAVGGYDPTFSHNEDAELDHRLALNGYSLWLTDRVRAQYIPRDSARALFRQYWRYGRGRTRTLLKHRLMPRARQLAPLLIAPAGAFALVGGGSMALGVPAGAILTLPALLWSLGCLAGGAVLALRSRRASNFLAGPAAMTMHLAWSLGALSMLGQSLRRRP